MFLAKNAVLSFRNLVHNQNYLSRSIVSNAVNTQCITKETNINTNLQNVPQLDKLYKKLEVEIKGADPAVLKSFSWFTTTAANHLGIDIGRWYYNIFKINLLINPQNGIFNFSWALRKSHKDRLTLLKSVHIYKKHRVQYEVRTYYRFMHFNKLTGSTLDTFLEYIQRNLPEGVALKATTTEILPIPEVLTKPPPVDNKNSN